MQHETTEMLAAVYPRVCGGTPFTYTDLGHSVGLSPRVRGNRVIASSPDRCRRSIPACAGEPRRVRPVCSACSVYPRVCGGTAGRHDFVLRPDGLSPRVRGNRPAGSRRVQRNRSIPACAGEPRTGGGSCKPRMVYPRVCGEPIAVDLPHNATRVYPRVCGGTERLVNGQWHGEGLSPRVRGNRVICQPHKRPEGSIPACAGEPALSLARYAPVRVYPRVCGGTMSGIVTAYRACYVVYPRVCGGTLCAKS